MSIRHGQSYGASGFCNSKKGAAYLPFGASEDAPKPSWQTRVLGIPADGVRDIPDVVMFPADGFAWSHYAAW